MGSEVETAQQLAELFLIGRRGRGPGATWLLMAVKSSEPGKELAASDSAPLLDGKKKSGKRRCTQRV